MGSYHVLFGIILEWFTYTIGGNFGIGSFFFCLCAYMHTYIWKCLSCHVATSLTLRSFVGLGRPGLDWIDMWYSCAHKVLIHIPHPYFPPLFFALVGAGCVFLHRWRFSPHTSLSTSLFHRRMAMDITTFAGFTIVHTVSCQLSRLMLSTVLLVEQPVPSAFLTILWEKLGFICNYLYYF